jgi:1-acyl-sn-glycerol-3-phosphate acyltransferase
MNHPNAFTDPILFTYVAYPLRTYYMARGDAFKPGLIAWLLEKIGIVPIFRIQDGGKEGLKKNDEAYRRVNHLLSRESKVIVFAEGLCVQERRLRPLKKGVARMVFGAFETINDDRLTVIPVGVNYSQPDKFRSNAFYNVGEPILVKDFIPLYKENAARANNAFLQVLEPRMKALVTHIDDKNYDQIVYWVERLVKKDMMREKGLDYKNLSQDFDVLTEITEKVNAAVINKRELVDEFKAKAGVYFSELKKHQLRDWLVNPNQNKNVNYRSLYVRYLLFIIGFPIHLWGLIGNYLPLATSNLLAGKVAKTKEFYSSMAIGFAMVIFMVNYCLWFFISWQFSPNIFYPLFIVISLALAGWFSLEYHPFWKKTLGMARILKDKKLKADLLEKRSFLINLINKF